MEIKRYLGGVLEVFIHNSERYIGVTYHNGSKHIRGYVSFDLWKYTIYINFKKGK